MNYNNIDIELCENVLSDIVYLDKHWMKTSDIETVKKTGAILRRLIVDQHLITAARFVGIDLEIYTLVPSSSLATKDYWQKAGGQLNGVRVASVEVRRGSRPEKFSPPIFKPVTYKDYLKQPVIIISGSEIYPEELIKYACNKLGIVHFDRKRDISKPLEQKFTKMDNTTVNIKILGENPIIIEFLSIGQDLSKSHTVKKLRRRLEKLDHTLKADPRSKS